MVGLGVDQVEFHFRGDDGAQAEFVVLAHDIGECLARVGKERCAVLLEQPERHDGGRLQRPADGERATTGCGADAVHVARGEDVA
jgi:predicted HD phosphohydrolase